MSETELVCDPSHDAAISDLRRALNSLPADNEFGTTAVRHLVTCALRAIEALTGASETTEVTDVMGEVRSAAVCAGMLTSHLRAVGHVRP